MTQVIILGAGAAGLAAAIWCRRLGLRPVLLEADGRRAGGQLWEIRLPIVDYPPFRAIEGGELARLLAEHARSLQTLVHLGARVHHFDPVQRQLETSVGDILCPSLIVATGARQRELGVEGEELLRRLPAPEKSGDAARDGATVTIVVGGGDRALGTAICLAKDGCEVMLVHRSSRFRARDETLAEALAHPRITVWTHATVKSIQGHVRPEALLVEHHGSVHRVRCKALLVRIGTVANSEFAQGALDLLPDGRIKTQGFGKTNVPNVWAIGDVTVEPQHSSLAVAMAGAMIVAKEVALGGNRQRALVRTRRGLSRVHVVTDGRIGRTGL